MSRTKGVGLLEAKREEIHGEIEKASPVKRIAFSREPH